MSIEGAQPLTEIVLEILCAPGTKVFGPDSNIGGGSLAGPVKTIECPPDGKIVVIQYSGGGSGKFPHLTFDQEVQHGAVMLGLIIFFCGVAIAAAWWFGLIGGHKLGYLKHKD